MQIFAVQHKPSVTDGKDHSSKDPIPKVLKSDVTRELSNPYVFCEKII